MGFTGVKFHLEISGVTWVPTEITAFFGPTLLGSLLCNFVGPTSMGGKLVKNEFGGRGNQTDSFFLYTSLDQFPLVAAIFDGRND